MDQKQKVVFDISYLAVAKVILVFLFFIFLFIIRDIILLVLVAVIMASAIEPVTVWFSRRGVKRIFAVIIIYLSLALMFMAVVYFFLPPALSESLGLINSVSDYINLNGAESQDGTLDFLAGSNEGGITIQEIITSVSNSFSDASNGLLASIRFIFGGIFSFTVIVVMSFYLAVREDGISDFLRIVTPGQYEEYVVNLWRRSQKKIGLWIQGQLLLALIVGVLVYFGLLIFGIPHALPLAILAAVFEIIPIMGPILSAIPGILIAFGMSGIAFALGIALMYLLIQQLESHVIYPLVVNKIIGISPIVVVIALIIGAKLGGFLGILLSVPISAILMEYINEAREKKSSNEPPLTV